MFGIMESSRSILLGCLLLGVAFWAAACGEPAPLDLSGPVSEWHEFGGDKGGLKYSALTQITPENVADLEPVWEYRHGDISDGMGEVTKTSFVATPIVAERTIYVCTGLARVIALDAETGEERWSFDPDLQGRSGEGPYPLTCRGVSYWAGHGGDPDALCARRIFTGTRDSELIALDAVTGTPCPDFGRNGRVDLREGIEEAPDWEYYPTSPPLVIGDVLVLGALVADQLRVDAPSGVVRAFDLETGALRWAWEPTPPEWGTRKERGLLADGEVYRAGTPNVWAPISGDEERGLVFVPTGNPSPDSYAALRDGADFYGSSTVALDASTGAVRWHYQFVHHDVWDYDTPAQPTLFQHPEVGGGGPALVQATKMGHLFLLDRETGEPLYPVEERPVPQAGAVPQEALSPTQPFPTHPKPIHPPDLTPDDAWGFTHFDKAYCRDLIERFRSDGIFTPPSLEGSIQYPGSAGGANWGGVSVDPERGILIVGQTFLPMSQRLVPREEFDQLDPASVVYPEELYPLEGTPYGLERQALLSNFGAPCVKPPWGSLTAVDLVSGEVLWTVPMGTTRDTAPFPLWFELGTPLAGGAMVTASGLIFIGATTDKYVRALSIEDGRELWRERIPFTANSTPVTYRLDEDGRQFLVVVAGGHGWSESGDAVVAYALPQDDP